MPPLKSPKGSPRGFLPRPLLRAGNPAEVLPNPFPQKNSFGKTESALEVRQFLPQGETRPSPAHAHTEKENQNRAKTKEAWARVQARAERHSRSGRTALVGCRGAEAVSWRNSLPHFVLEIGSNLVQ